jgi:nucleoside-diphosphate-sugar epimerase
MDKILLTGAAGFIGWKTSELLLSNDYSVIGLDNMNDYYDVRLKEWRLNQLKRFNNFKFYQIDIENSAELMSVFSENPGIKAIINLAARAGVRYSLLNPHIYFTTNAQGTLNLLELMPGYNIGKMVLASTSSLYSGQKMPFREDLPVNTPISPYAASKKAAEVIAYTYHYLYKIDISVVRFFTVYGPAGRPDMSYFRFIKWIDEGKDIILYGDGSQSRDFTYIDDIVEGTINALKPVGYEIINLGNSQPHDLRELIAIIEKLLGKEAKYIIKPFELTDMKATYADISKARQLLGWKPRVMLREGLTKTIEWYKENYSWVKDINIDIAK